MVYGLEQCLYVKVNKIKIFIRLSDNKNKRVDWFTDETASELVDSSETEKCRKGFKPIAYWLLEYPQRFSQNECSLDEVKSLKTVGVLS